MSNHTHDCRSCGTDMRVNYPHNEARCNIERLASPLLRLEVIEKSSIKALPEAIKEIERLTVEVSRLEFIESEIRKVLKQALDENSTLIKALEDIEQMEPGLLDGDSSCDMSAAVAGMALAACGSGGPAPQSKSQERRFAHQVDKPTG